VQIVLSQELLHVREEQSVGWILQTALQRSQSLQRKINLNFFNQ